ncbi:MAG: glucosaminidase domain-containing protein [Phaeodactylibacter sp.]|uniref:glycoside hydrolase family 73 protein n=1 Tax=Phaeodactylibacter sp. TaxID=1940289 RepID=UPI0032ED6CE1
MKRLRPLIRYSTFALGLTLVCSFISERNQETATERPWKVRAYIQKHDFLAEALHQETGIPKAIIYAMAGLESDWGRSELARYANNHFGIKSKPDWRGLEYCKPTQEYDGQQFRTEKECFKKYPLIRRSYEDFGYFLMQNKRYAALRGLEADDYTGWTDAIQRGGYATDPEYAQKLRGIIWRYRLAKLP